MRKRIKITSFHSQMKLFSIISAVMVLACLLSSGVPAFGYQKSANLPEEEENIFRKSLEELLNMEVVTASGKDQKAYEAPATIYVIPSEQIRVKETLGITLGLRYDYNTRYGSTINPRIGFTYTPSGKWKIKLLYGQAYLAPAVDYEQYGLKTSSALRLSAFLKVSNLLNARYFNVGPLDRSPTPQGLIRFLLGLNLQMGKHQGEESSRP